MEARVCEEAVGRQRIVRSPQKLEKARKHPKSLQKDSGQTPRFPSSETDFRCWPPELQ